MSGEKHEPGTSWGRVDAYAIRAEVRHVESGHNVRLGEWQDSYIVNSESRPGVTHIVVIRPDETNNRWLSSCSCPAGQHHLDLHVPCRHAAGVMHRLEREGKAHWDGVWRLRPQPPLPPGPEDVFAGLNDDRQMIAPAPKPVTPSREDGARFPPMTERTENDQDVDRPRLF